MPLRVNFHIANIDTATDIYLNKVLVEHELRTTLVGGENDTKTTFWGLSSSRFAYSDKEETTDVNLSAAEVKEIHQKLGQPQGLTIESETISVIDLGFYSNRENNRNFKLITEKQKIEPSEVRFFEFRFLMSKEILGKFTTMVPEEEQFTVFENDDYDYNNEFSFSPSEISLTGIDDGYSIENIEELRLKLSIILTGVASNGECSFINYYEYR